jgi:excinuclease ABC subunit C
VGVRPSAVALLPTEPGVYRFRDDGGCALYIGRAGDLRRRVSSYWGDLRDRPRLRRMVPQIVWIEALVCASEHEAAWVERMLLEHRKPRWNRVVGGLENPVYVRLDALAPSIGVAHEVVETAGVRWYGPYLGGTASRLAVAGLERVYPLTYTRSRLRGTERDLARVHKVGEADAATLTSEVELVLRGDPTAVCSARELLAARRDEAAGRELYELAARIHDELGGLDWVVSPVRFVGTADLDLVATSGGERLSLSLRAGRLCTWTQTHLTEEGASRSFQGVSTVSGPVEWHDFLSRNATLAAALRAHPLPD